MLRSTSAALPLNLLPHDSRVATEGLRDTHQGESNTKTYDGLPDKTIDLLQLEQNESQAVESLNHMLS